MTADDRSKLLEAAISQIEKSYGKGSIMRLGSRDVLVPGLNKLGWPVELPKATMFAWARIPEQYRSLGSIEFSKKLLAEAKVAVSPGVGFGEHGDGHVRFSLIENEERTRQALRGIKQMFRNG